VAFSSDIALNDASAASKTFREIQSPDGSLRLDTSSTLAEPRTLSIKHQTQTGKDGRVTDKHLISFTQVKNDSVTGPASSVVNMTIAMPRTGPITRAMVDDLIAFVKNLLTTTNVTALLNNEV
jgi:bifunctional N-acetylglucosamine-1-phosphate-uridyltransferase/glucosamine-1-phosphate-acetyltransferase GlmU-like protein